jgi:hypothetical protein
MGCYSGSKLDTEGGGDVWRPEAGIMQSVDAQLVTG